MSSAVNFFSTLPLRPATAVLSCGPTLVVAPHPDDETLGQQRLPEFGAETEHHEAEDDAEAADEQEEAEMSSVKNGTRASADEEDAYRPVKASERLIRFVQAVGLIMKNPTNLLYRSNP